MLKGLDGLVPIVRGCSQIMSAKNGGVKSPPSPLCQPASPPASQKYVGSAGALLPGKFLRIRIFFALNILLSIISWTCLGNHWSFWKISGLSGKLTDFLERFWIGEKSWEEGSVGGSPGAGRKSVGGPVPHSWGGRPWCRAERVGGSAWPHSETILPWFAAILSCATSCLSIGLSLTRYNKRVKRVRGWGTPHQ